MSPVGRLPVGKLDCVYHLGLHNELMRWAVAERGTVTQKYRQILAGFHFAEWTSRKEVETSFSMS